MPEYCDKPDFRVAPKPVARKLEARLVVAVNLLVCLALAVVGGIGSARYLIASGSPLTTRHFGPWEVWKDAGRVESDPYTRAHLATTGQLPVGSRNALYFLATRDSAGSRLDTRCVYTVSGRGPGAVWWSLSPYDADGKLFANEAQRYAYSSASVMRGGDGTYAIMVARDAGAGNWLPVSGSGNFQLMLSAYGLDGLDGRGTADSDGLSALPTIVKGACR